MSDSRELVRGIYAVLPIEVYNGPSSVPQYTLPFSGKAIPAHNMFEGTFAERYPNARQNNDGTKVIIKDASWTKYDQFDLEAIIATAGFQEQDENGDMQYGTMQWSEVREMMQRDEWTEEPW